MRFSRLFAAGVALFAASVALAQAPSYANAQSLRIHSQTV
jgi:hypothetical protein